MGLRDIFADLRTRVLLRDAVKELRRIANALEEQNLVRGAPRGTSFHSLYEDKNSGEDADLQFPSDEYFAELERLEQAKKKDMGPEADLSDEDVEDLSSQ